MLLSGGKHEGRKKQRGVCAAAVAVAASGVPCSTFDGVAGCGGACFAVMDIK